MFTIGIICGGPTQERGISLNSARTLIDHLHVENTNIKAFFVDEQLNFFLIDSSSLYSNTPRDFDFKIDQIAKKINEDTLAATLKQCDIMFPLIHGIFGEDGQLQALLEQFSVPYVGSSSQACRKAYPKNKAQALLSQDDYPTIPFLKIDSETTLHSMESFWNNHCKHSGIIKPNRSGSSLGVTKIESFDQLKDMKNALLEKYGELQLQSFCQLKEITIIVTTNQKQEPVALIPTETVLQGNHTDIYDYRAKYLPTNACRLHTPPNISAKSLQDCRHTAEKIFKFFNLQDFARLDGWVCPTRGFMCNDINIISGLEENSFLFKQASICGFNHEDIIYKVLQSACARQNITLPPRINHAQQNKKPVYVICGGASSERQVSLMSGRNSWFKLESSTQYQPIPFFMDAHHRIWKMPHALFLHHTVEEIMSDIAVFSKKNDLIGPTVKQILSRLGVDDHHKPTLEEMDLDTWIDSAKNNQAAVLLALHGGIGENGAIQQKLQSKNIPFNGSHSETSQICMNKNATINKIQQMQHPDIQVQSQTVISIEELSVISKCSDTATTFWEQSIKDNHIMIIKPLSDGCSSGIVCITSHEELKTYASIIMADEKTAAANTFYHQPNPIELPTKSQNFLLEPYIQTDDLSIMDSKIIHQHHSGWFELTIVIRERLGSYHAFNPSITISEHAVLSVEEKFQGGTGINLTPPPNHLISQDQIAHIKELACCIGLAVDIRQYARLDIFYNTQKNRLQLIEINTLPALTPSTVLFQQALAETPAIKPKAFLEQLIGENALVEAE